MTALEYGPVEVYSVAFEGEYPDPKVFATLDELARSGVIRVLDLVVGQNVGDDVLSLTELADIPNLEDFIAADLHLPGLISEEDMIELAETVDADRNIAVIAIELLWVKALGGQFLASGGSVERIDRIPADAVKAIVSEAKRG